MRTRTLVALSASCLVVAMTMGPRTSPVFAQAGSTGAGSTGGGATSPGGVTPGPAPPSPGPTIPGPTAPGGPISPGPPMPGPTRPGGTTGTSTTPGTTPSPMTPGAPGSSGTTSQSLTPGSSAPSGARIQQPGSGMAAPTPATGIGTSGTTVPNAEVRRLQEQLRSQGHDPGAIDGVMGTQTQDALRAFQRRNGLSETGRLDTQTAEKLGLGTIRR